MARIECYRLIDVVTGASRTFSLHEGKILPVDNPVDEKAPGMPDLIALVPADRCSMIRVALPEMSASRMAQALRWAVEDSIAGDPEQQHVVPVRRDDAGRLLCLVVARADMDRWLAALPARPARMVPDAACLPCSEGEVVLMSADGAVLARAGKDIFDRMEPALLDSMVPEFMEKAGDQARLVWLGDHLPDEISRFSPESRPAVGGPLEVLGAGALGSAGADIDLLQGDYAPHDKASTTRQWRLAAGLAGLAVFLLLAGALVDYALLSREQQRLEAELQGRFSELFPDISTIVRPRAQAERALSALRGGSRDRFVQLMRAVSPLFSGAAGVDVDSISYIDGTLDLELETSSLADLEALQRQLRAQGIDALLENVEVLTDSTRGRLRVPEVGS